MTQHSENGAGTKPRAIASVEHDFNDLVRQTPPPVDPAG